MSRPRKTTVMRDKSGKSRGEPSFIHPETLAVRERQLKQDGIILEFRKFIAGREYVRKTAEDAHAGFSLGRLFLRHQQGDRVGGISQEQFEAGEAWARLCRAHAAIMGYARGTGGHSHTELSDEQILDLRERWRNCYDALVDASGRDDRGVRVTYGICVEDWPLGQLYAQDYGKLRECLNAIGRALDSHKK